MKKIIKTILLVLNVVALLLLLGSTMAGTVAPSKFIGFSLLSYGYLYFLIINVVFVVLWLMFSSKWFILSLAGILFRMSFIPLYFQVGGVDSVEEASTSQIKVMTFNVHQFRGVDFARGDNDSNKLSFIQLVEEEQPDVLVLQEYVGRGNAVRLTEQLTLMGYAHKHSGNERGSMTGNVIFSKLPIIDVARIDGFSKIYADLLWNEDTVRFYCLHLDSYRLDKSDQKQIHDISHGNVDSTTGRGTLMKFRETILMHEREWDTLCPYFEGRDRLTVVAGDFNDTPASFFYQKCRKLYDDSYCDAGQGFSTTYHGIFTHHLAFRIDLVLHTRDMEVVAYHRLKSEISDHYPIVVTLKKK